MRETRMQELRKGEKIQKYHTSISLVLERSQRKPHTKKIKKVKDGNKEVQVEIRWLKRTN